MDQEKYSIKLLNLLYNYITKKVTAIKEEINKIKEEVNKINDSFSKDKDVLEDKININKNSIDNAEESILSLTSKIKDLENNPNVDGDYIQINNIEQTEIENVKAGETIELENKNNKNDFIIQCFAQTEEGEHVILKSIECKPENKDLFEFDERYIELTNDGFRPKTYTTMDMEKIEEIDNYVIYATTDTITQELLDNINNISAVEVK